jgi:lipoprotein-anchoring transpeptidase ErfK/SrfK
VTGRTWWMAAGSLVLAVLIIAVWVVQVQPDRLRAAVKVKPAPHAETVVTRPKAAPPPAGVLVATSKVGALPISSEPDAKVNQSLSNPNSLGAPLVLLVAQSKPGWVEVYLPERPNEAKGWTPTGDVSLVRDTERIFVSLSQRHLELFKGKQLVFQATAAVGSAGSPTPTGYFYVTEVLKVVGGESDNPYGPYALGLSGFSNTYKTFEGGPGQIAIHRTDQPWVIGQYASHGCVRLNNTEIAQLAPLVEAGTPVEIVA